MGSKNSSYAYGLILQSPCQFCKYLPYSPFKNMKFCMIICSWMVSSNLKLSKNAVFSCILIFHPKWLICFQFQNELAEYLSRMKTERIEVEQPKPATHVQGSSKRKSASTPATTISPPKSTSKGRKHTSKAIHQSPPTNTNTKTNKKEKLLCSCRTPYDDTK